MSPPARFLVSLIQIPRRPAATRPHLNTLSKPFRRPTPSPRSASSSELPQQFTQFSDAVRKRRYRNLRRVLTVAIFGFIGYNSGLLLAPPRLEVYEPGIPEDIEELEYLQEEFDDSTLVKGLRADANFAESEAYSDLTPEQKEKRLTSGVLKGSRGISLQHVFSHRTTISAGTIMHLGPGLEGHPGVVHGGAISTIADEAMGRLAMRGLGTKQLVTANLEIKFTHPMRSCQFVTILAGFNEEKSTDRKAIIEGEVRDESNQTCAELNATFVVPKDYPSTEGAPDY